MCFQIVWATFGSCLWSLVSLIFVRHDLKAMVQWWSFNSLDSVGYRRIMKDQFHGSSFKQPVPRCPGYSKTCQVASWLELFAAGEPAFRWVCPARPMCIAAWRANNEQCKRSTRDGRIKFCFWGHWILIDSPTFLETNINIYKLVIQKYRIKLNNVLSWLVVPLVEYWTNYVYAWSVA